MSCLARVGRVYAAAVPKHWLQAANPEHRGPLRFTSSTYIQSPLLTKGENRMSRCGGAYCDPSVWEASYLWIGE